MILETRHLRMIDAINREGGVSRAAQQLHLTQPAVSHALRDLEDRLGVQLFSRSGKRMAPTREGERLLRTADIVLEELHHAERDIAEHKAGRLGVLRIATQCYTCYHWLPSVIKLFLRDFPGIDIQIIPEATRRPVEALAEGRLDLAIVQTEPNHEGIVAEPLFGDEMVAIMPPNHPLAGREFLEAADFANEHLVIHFDSKASTVFSHLLTPAGVSPRRTSELQLTEAVVETVKAGLGISVVARWAVEPELTAGTLRAVKLTADGLRRTWYAATLLRRSDTTALAALTHLLRNCAGPTRKA